MGLESFLDPEMDVTRSLAVVNRTSPRPVQRMLEGLFEEQPVAIDEADLPEGENTVVLSDGEDVLATSPLEDVQESILLVNSDIYVTGARTLEDSELPDVLAGLDGVQFRMRGYPESNSEKLLLISVSRLIERMAWKHNDGTLRASFQRLDRIRDERGTYSVYRELADSGVDTHVYGLPGSTSPAELDLTVHEGRDSDFRDSWFVVFTSEDDSVADAALLAIEIASDLWKGFWTYDSQRVREIDRYIEREL